MLSQYCFIHCSPPTPLNQWERALCKEEGIWPVRPLLFDSEEDAVRVETLVLCTSNKALQVNRVLQYLLWILPVWGGSSYSVLSWTKTFGVFQHLLRKLIRTLMCGGQNNTLILNICMKLRSAMENLTNLSLASTDQPNCQNKCWFCPFCKTWFCCH